MIIFYIVFSMKIHYQAYFGSLAAIYITYALVILGVFHAVPKYVLGWHLFVQLCLCIFLMFRYHPFRQKYAFKPNDARLIFGAAMLLFVNIVVSVPAFYAYIHFVESTIGLRRLNNMDKDINKK